MSGTWITTRAWLLMLPLLIIMIGVIGWPLADTVMLSFTDAKLIGTSGSFVGTARSSHCALPQTAEQLGQRMMKLVTALSFPRRFFST